MWFGDDDQVGAHTERFQQVFRLLQTPKQPRPSAGNSHTHPKPRCTRAAAQGTCCPLLSQEQTVTAPPFPRASSSRRSRLQTFLMCRSLFFFFYMGIVILYREITLTGNQLAFLLVTLRLHWGVALLGGVLQPRCQLAGPSSEPTARSQRPGTLPVPFWGRCRAFAPASAGGLD